MRYGSQSIVSNMKPGRHSYRDQSVIWFVISTSPLSFRLSVNRLNMFDLDIEPTDYSFDESTSTPEFHYRGEFVSGIFNHTG